MDATQDKPRVASPSEAAAAAHAAGAGVRPDIWGRLLRTANHPNGLTLIRVACIPPIIVAFSFPSNAFLCFLAALLFSFAACVTAHSICSMNGAGLQTTCRVSEASFSIRSKRAARSVCFTSS